MAKNTGNQLVVYEPIIADESLRLWRFNGEHNIFEEFSIKQDIGLERIEYIASNGQVFWGAFRDGEDKLIIGSFELDDKELNVGNFSFLTEQHPPLQVLTAISTRPELHCWLRLPVGLLLVCIMIMEVAV